jgi:hypothetical protein
MPSVCALQKVGAEHRLPMTQTYIDINRDAKRKVVDMW